MLKAKALEIKRQKYRVFYQLEKQLELPMFVLSMVWLYLFIVELVKGLTPFQETLILVIWVLFIAEFLLKLLLAPRKFSFIKHNWLTVIALVVPALRVLRVLNAFRILQSVRVVNSTKIIRAITSGRRFISELKDAQGPKPDPEVFVGMVAAAGQASNKEILKQFAQSLVNAVKPELEESTGIKWHFDVIDAVMRKPVS